MEAGRSDDEAGSDGRDDAGACASPAKDRVPRAGRSGRPARVDAFFFFFLKRLSLFGA